MARKLVNYLQWNVRGSFRDSNEERKWHSLCFCKQSYCFRLKEIEGVTTEPAAGFGNFFSILITCCVPIRDDRPSNRL
jgi:hypothetical protein